MRWINEIFDSPRTASIAGPILKLLHIYSHVRSIWLRLRVANTTSPFRRLWTRLAPTYILIPDGQRLYLDNYTSGVSAELLLNGGYYERGTTELFRTLTGEGANVVDVGAHIGYYTLLAAKGVGEKGKVYAFEPAPDNCKMLIKNVTANRLTNVIIIDKAVSDRCQIDELVLSEGDSGGNTLNKPAGYKKGISVETTTLDEYFKGKETPIRLVKIDVEGAEYAVLKGMANIIRLNDNLKIITELIPYRLEGAGVSIQDYLDMIASYGFKVYIIDEEKQTVKPVKTDEILGMWHIEKRRNLYLEK